MDQPFPIDTVPWKPVRPEITDRVFGRSLLEGAVKAVLTRVEPGGGFRPHADAYAHLFYFLEGRGTLMVDGVRSEARPGVVARIRAGVPHAYDNTGEVDLVLLSLNLPALEDGSILLSHGADGDPEGMPIRRQQAEGTPRGPSIATMNS